MKKILLIAPTGGNGGINTWTRNYLKMFKSDNFELVSLDSSLKYRSHHTSSIIKRSIAGLLDLRWLLKRAHVLLKENQFSIMHTTTSGSLGTLRDYVLGRVCKRSCLKLIMHCRYGCIPDVIGKNNFFSKFLLKTMRLYDQVWVLDSKTENCLKKFSDLKNKVFLIPNCIDVPELNESDFPTTFQNIAFIANLQPTKGLFELIEAVKKTEKDVKLSIVGPGSDIVIEKIKQTAGNLLAKKIFLLGPKSNADAVQFLKNQDILALPTYFPSEAFPISILEAMSLGKLVISTDRAAIPDMLTGIDGVKAGILVEEKSSDSIQHAIEWIIDHPAESSQICKNAYKKVSLCYERSVVHNIYEKHYMELVG